VQQVNRVAHPADSGDDLIPEYTVEDHALKGADAPRQYKDGQINPYAPISLHKEKGPTKKRHQIPPPVNGRTFVSIDYINIRQQKSGKEELNGVEDGQPNPGGAIPVERLNDPGKKDDPGQRCSPRHPGPDSKNHRQGRREAIELHLNLKCPGDRVNRTLLSEPQVVQVDEAPARTRRAKQISRLTM
jgi:hypothetical protein